jgi:hypothetical protein
MELAVASGCRAGPPSYIGLRSDGTVRQPVARASALYQSGTKNWHSVPDRLERGGEGWTLLTVETEVNGDSKSTNEKTSFLDWFVGFVLPVQEIFVLPWLL